MFNEPSKNNPLLGSTRSQPYIREGSRAANKQTRTPSGAVSKLSKGQFVREGYPHLCKFVQEYMCFLSFSGFGGVGGVFRNQKEPKRGFTQKRRSSSPL